MPVSLSTLCILLRLAQALAAWRRVKARRHAAVRIVWVSAHRSR